MAEYIPANPSLGDLERYASEKNALEEAQKTGTADYAVVLTNMAACLGSQGRDEEAIELYMQAKVAHEASGSTDTPAYADALQNIGDHFNDQHRYDDAMELFLAARAVYEAIGWQNTMNFAVVLHNLGLCSFKKGERMEAIRYYNDAKHTYEGILLARDSPQYAELLQDMDEAGVSGDALAVSDGVSKVDLRGLD